jgi:hypothetical protein
MNEKLKRQLEEIVSKASKRIENKLEVKAKDLLSQFLNKLKVKHDRDIS